MNRPIMQSTNARTTPVAAAAAGLAALLLAACASTPIPPAALVDARATVRSAEVDRDVLAYAPLELKKATDSLNRANRQFTDGAPSSEIGTSAYVAGQQARTAMALARAKASDKAISAAEADRERARADMRTAEADRAKAVAENAQARAGAAQQQAAMSAQLATEAERRTAAARQQTNDAELRSQQAQAAAGALQQQADLLQQQMAELQAKQTERGMLVTLGDVLFEFNRADVKPGARASLLKLADFLQAHPNRQILIEGHTDNIGSDAANQLLSRRRAEAVDTALLGMGVTAARMATVGYGEEFPVADNGSDTNRALNRRVEVYIAEAGEPVRARR